MSKQDRQGARTPADVQRRFDGSFAEMERAVKQLDSEISAELSLKIGSDESGKVIAMINASADTITIKGNRLTIESTNFELTQDGTVKAKAGEIGGCSIVDGVLKIKNANIGEKLTAEQIDATNLKVKSANIEDKLTAEQIDATNLKVKSANIDGKLTAEQIDAKGLTVEAANITGTLKADQIEGIDLRVNAADIQGKLTAEQIESVGGWTIGEVEIPQIFSIITDYALYSGAHEYGTGILGEIPYTLETWLTPKGIYCRKTTTKSDGSRNIYYASKKWEDLMQW